MFFTRSIRQKLMTGLVLVGVLVGASIWFSFQGVSSIRSTVDDLELSIAKLPRRADLISSFSELYAPFMVDFPGPEVPEEIRQQRAIQQQDYFEKTFLAVRQSVQQFRLGMQQLDDKLKHSPAEQLPHRGLLNTADNGLHAIEEAIPGLSNLERRDVSVRAITHTTTRIIENIRNSIDPVGRLGERLQDAKNVSMRQHRTVLILGLVSVVVLIVQGMWYYELIFKPIQKLVSGVKRLGAGEYGYRVQVQSQCEIGGLAQAFNVMSTGIQEDRESKQREIEERSKQLVQSERLAGAGFLASGVAHEINNPLSVIMTAAYGLEMRLTDEVLESLPEEDKNDVREYLGLIQSESERCERITKKLLDFSYGQAEERNLYDVGAIIDEVVSMVSHLSRYQDRNIEFNHPEPMHGWINAAEIKQVILNLVANALDATPTGGNVRIQLKERAEQVEIAVADNGCGMTREQMAHIFEPFFTTKEVGKGTGLGLAITHRIVRDHGGTLEVYSEGPGMGSQFTLRVPKRERSLQAA